MGKEKEYNLLGDGYYIGNIYYDESGNTTGFFVFKGPTRKKISMYFPHHLKLSDIKADETIISAIKNKFKSSPRMPIRNESINKNYKSFFEMHYDDIDSGYDMEPEADDTHRKFMANKFPGFYKRGQVPSDYFGRGGEPGVEDDKEDNFRIDSDFDTDFGRDNDNIHFDSDIYESVLEEGAVFPRHNISEFKTFEKYRKEVCKAVKSAFKKMDTEMFDDSTLLGRSKPRVANIHWQLVSQLQSIFTKDNLNLNMVVKPSPKNVFEVIYMNVDDNFYCYIKLPNYSMHTATLKVIADKLYDMCEKEELQTYPTYSQIKATWPWDSNSPFEQNY